MGRPSSNAKVPTAMKRIAAARVALVALLLVLAARPVMAQAVAAPAKSVAKSLQPFIDHNVLAGAVTLVATREKVLLVETIGYADIAAKKPMQADNLFWIASMTKPITSTALMMLVDEGKVRIDDPVEKYLPEFKGQKVSVEVEKGKVELKPPAHPITVKNLLTHTSGLVSKAVEGKKWDMTTLRSAVESYAALPLKFEPDSKYEYNNPGINTAGRIIEVVSGMPYEEFLAQRLFRPLGMVDTTFWPTPAQVARLAKTYRPTADKSGIELAPSFAFYDTATGRKNMPMPAGGLFSTAADLASFCRMILSEGTLDGKRYLSAEAVRQMGSTQTGSLPVPYGLAWATDRTPGGPFGHGGAHKTEMHIFPKQGLVTVLLVQHTLWRNDEGNRIVPTFHQAALRELGSQGK